MRGSAVTLAAILMMAVGIVAFFFFLHRPALPQMTHGSMVMEQTIELPPGQRLIHAEIGRRGEAYYRYAPLQPGEQPRSSTVEGRWNNGSSIGKIHFIERAAE